MCALTRALSRVLTCEDESCRTLGLDGRRPLRPFRLSVLTTAEHDGRQEAGLSGRTVRLRPEHHSEVTFFDHAHCEALLEATVLAPVPPAFVHGAAFGGQAHVLGVFLYRPLH